MILVVKIGTSSLTDKLGNLELSRINSLIAELAALKEAGHDVVLVTSAAIAAGKPALNLKTHPKDYTSLQALATIGQSRLMSVYEKELNSFGIVGGQVLVTLDDFALRNHYLRVRSVMEKLLEMGVIPIVNENDAITDEEIRFGDNDRLAAMVAHLVKAELLILLTDTEGLYTGDPRVEEDVSLVAEIEEIDRELELAAKDTTSQAARGGMASKLAAARIAAWSGIRCVIASSFVPDVLASILKGESMGTQFKPKKNYLNSRKLWIGFAAKSKGVVHVDQGAQDALIQKSTSLLPVGVTRIDGSFERGEAVEIKGPEGNLIAKGLVSVSAKEFSEKFSEKSGAAGEKEGERGDERERGQRGHKSIEFVHRDDLVVLVGLN